MSATPKWDAWLARMLPDPEAREIVKQYSKGSLHIRNGWLEFKSGEFVCRCGELLNFRDGVALNDGNIVLGQTALRGGLGKVSIGLAKDHLKHRRFGFLLRLWEFVGHFHSFLSRGGRQ